MVWDYFVCFPFLSWVVTTVLLLLYLSQCSAWLSLCKPPFLSVVIKAECCFTFPVCCSLSSSQCGMKFVVLSIPETSHQQPCEVNKDVLKTLLCKWRNQGKRLICLRPGPGWQMELELKAFLPPTFSFKYNVLENLQDEFQKVTMFWF